MELAANDTPMSNSAPSATGSTAGPNPSAPDAADTHAPAKDNGDSQSDAARMERLFEGLDRLHGTYNPAKATTNAKGKTETHNADTRTLQGPPTVHLWKRHLAGEYPLGVSPIRSDSTSVWGAIDIDDYMLSHRDLAKKIADLDLPLIVCKSKSNGAHLFLFLSKPMPTAKLQKRLAAMLPLLDLPADTEVFPKSSDPTGSGWIFMPYMKADGGKEYAVDAKGHGLSLFRFLEAAEKGKVDPAKIAGLIAKAKKSLEAELDADETDADERGSVERFSAWLESELKRVENAPPSDADDTFFGFAKDIGRYAGELDVDVKRDDLDDIFLWGLRIGEIKSRAMEAWKTRKGTLDRFDEQWKNGLRAGVKEGNPPWPRSEGAQLEDFCSYMLSLYYIYRPTGDLWPTARINSRFGKRELNGKKVIASRWLDIMQPVEQIAWYPGEPQLMRNRLVKDGHLVVSSGTTVYNLYNPPTVNPVANPDASPWIDHIRRLYPDEADHIIKWLAHRVQRPGEKIQHALVLGGNHGVGKDSILNPVRYAIGKGNMREVDQKKVMGQYNTFLRSVILRVKEARNLGASSIVFFNEIKKIIDGEEVVQIDEKFMREYHVPNVSAVVFTTNYKVDGIYLTADDRRHFVAWTDLTRSEDFDDQYFVKLYRWFSEGGNDHVAAYLMAYDLSDFRATEPPPKTAAFWEMVDAHRPTEDAALIDVLERLGRPDAITIRMLADTAEDMGLADFGQWLRDKENSTKVKPRLESAGYVSVKYPDAKHGYWKVGGNRCAVYVKSEMLMTDRLRAAAAVQWPPI